jgi:hypothetical protein
VGPACAIGDAVAACSRFATVCSGYRYQLSILQAKFSLNQVLDQPVTGHIFFEEVISENP